jgi:phosphohistidine swiveling domain-containing protein
LAYDHEKYRAGANWEDVMGVDHVNAGQAGLNNVGMQGGRSGPVPASAPLLASGRAIGRQTVTGTGRFVATAKDLEAFQAGEILMADMTLPEWREVMERAAAIVTNRGDDGSHAAVMALSLGVPAVVGTVDGASRLWTGATLTIACDRSGVGRVYEAGPSCDSVTDETC